ncbi:hypothetical protein [uncultured Aliiroseovarius sp.]|uniref:hypothetical protein n=1 Tax=uncultured Aliiroseovarius sp. TaxID=1658783 RepID=UPI002592F4E3|nr:hypothetical protein [uncultured Aliiroseovarius sp.]
MTSHHWKPFNASEMRHDAQRWLKAQVSGADVLLSVDGPFAGCTALAVVRPEGKRTPIIGMGCGRMNLSKV